MSIADFWKDMYEDTLKREVALREGKHQAQMQLIRCEGQRFSMLFSLQLASDLLKDSHPSFAEHLLNNIQQWKQQYEGQFLEKALGQVISLESALSRHKGPQASAQAQTTVGMQKSAVEWESMSFPAIPSLLKKQAE